MLLDEQQAKQFDKLDRILRQSIETTESESGLPEWVGKFGISPSGPGGPMMG